MNTKRKDKLRLYFDFDETIAMSIKAFIDVLEQRHWREIQEGKISKLPHWNDIQTWDFKEISWLRNGITMGTFSNPLFFENLNFYTDPTGLTMSNVIERLCKNENLDIFIATKGDMRNLSLKKEWIRHNMPYFNMNNYIGMEGVLMDKSELNGWLIVDDHESNIKTANCKHKILMAHRGRATDYNNELIHDKNQMVSISCSEIYNMITDLLNEELNKNDEKDVEV